MGLNLDLKPIYSLFTPSFWPTLYLTIRQKTEPLWLCPSVSGFFLFSYFIFSLTVMQQDVLQTEKCEKSHKDTQYQALQMPPVHCCSVRSVCNLQMSQSLGFSFISTSVLMYRFKILGEKLQDYMKRSKALFL